MVWGGGFPLGTPEGLLAPGSGKSSPKKEPSHFPRNQPAPCSAQICEGNLATPHRQQLASHHFHGTTVAQKQAFGLLLLFAPYGVLGSHSPAGLGQLHPSSRVLGA